ncbi:calponin homology domain-containing protein DDB_G0272472-like [Euwallacea similis]|uniref:calponin homology domain-containing protein DDB_G0272472-like n=1 Tax=Euwallacea similis TaxID=1736056 RepID=UPI00344F4812
MSFLIIFTIFILPLEINTEDVFYTINTKRPLYQVSEKFLSVSIDPAVLLAEVNLSDTSLSLIKHLSPAYIRLAGPSTQYVKYIDDEDAALYHKKKGDNIYITPSMWFGINEWLSLANLTPVFGINDRNTVKGVWDPRATLPLLEMSEKLGVKCYWQLGADCTKKTIIQYVDDLHILEQTLKGFPEHADSWKVVGSDLSSCNFDNAVNGGLEQYIKDLDESVNAVMWQSVPISKNYIGFKKTEFWTSVPKDDRPATFPSAIQWARKVGEAASLGYDVIFREPRVTEFIRDTPVYWFSLLHKNLMGTIVLEAQALYENPNLAIFGHCTKPPHNGAITIMVINNGSEPSSAKFRVGSALMERSTEIQSYFLTEANEGAGKALLNGQPLSMDLLQAPEDLLKPKLKREKLWPHLSLEVSSNTVAFFVITGINCSLCMQNQGELLAEDIGEDQSGEKQFKIEQRMQLGSLLTKAPFGNKNALRNIKKNILKEVEADRAFYDKIAKNSNLDVNFVGKDKMSTKVKHGPSSSNLHLTIHEIEDILKGRARAKAATKNIGLTSAELDMLVDKATLKIPKYFVAKRDINRVLLEEKAKFYQNNMFSQETYEKLAKENKKSTKLLPLSRMRLKRSINTPLLNMRAMLEEIEKYLKEDKKTHSDENCKMKRDINLDLLKQKSQSHQKGSIQPSAKRPQKLDFWNEEKNLDSLDLAGQSSDELFDDLKQFEDKAFEELLEPDEVPFRSNLPESRLLPKKARIFSSPLLEPSFTQFKSKLPKNQRRIVSPYPEDDEDNLQFLKQLSEEFVEDEELTPYRKLPVVKNGKMLRDMREFGSKRDKNKKSMCADLGEFYFSEELEDSYLRRRRSSGDENKIRKNKMRNEVKKLRIKIKEEKNKYLREKLDAKQKQKLEKVRRTKTNIQKVPRYLWDKYVIDRANSSENALAPPGGIPLQKRSAKEDGQIVFGHYSPLSKPMEKLRPVDALKVDTNDTKLPHPLYSWMLDERLKNSLVKTESSRKRRYISTNSLNLNTNGIDDDDVNKIDDINRNIMRFTGIKPDSSLLSEIKDNKFWTSFTSTTLKPETVPNNNITKEKAMANENGASKVTYLQKVLGREKGKAIEVFIQGIKDQFSNMGSKIKSLLERIF